MSVTVVVGPLSSVVAVRGFNFNIAEEGIIALIVLV